MKKRRLVKRAISIVLASAMLLGLSGCDKQNGNSLSADEMQAKIEEDNADKEKKHGGTSGEDSGYNPYPDGPSIRTSFTDFASVGEYEIVTDASVSDYQVAEDFSNVSNIDRYSYIIDNADMKNKLLQNGFVVSDEGHDEFFSLYESNRYEYLANFVTTDSMLHTYHLYFAYLLKTCEKNYFTSNLKTVCGLMVDTSKSQYEALAGSEWENAALRNLAYFSVAAKLFDPNVEVDPLVSDVVNQEISLIEAAGAIAESPVMNMGGNSEKPYQEDYTQYIVRGYYTESDELSRYFKAMMWFGRMTFRQSEADETKSAVLITKAMENEEIRSNWSAVYDVTSFFMGNSDDPGIYDYYPVVESIYTDMSISSVVGDEGKWNDLNTALSQLEPPVINSIPIEDGLSEEEKAASINGFRFMGQRGTFDAAAFQKLIHSEVKNRYLPSAMDIPAVLGSEEAKNILNEEGHFNYENYGDNLASIQTSVENTDDSVWNSTLYNSWIFTLRPLTEEKGEGYPQFMRNKAWSRKQLNTFLGSYAELKHDSILYAKQVYAEMGGGGDLEETDYRGYVEPEPLVYARIANLAAMTRDGLQGYGMISENDAEMLTLLQQLSEQLLTISNKELRNESLTEEEHELIKSYGGQLEHFWKEALKDKADANGYIDQQENPAAIIADIATDPNGSCLEVGTGYVNKIYVLVNVEGVIKIATGTVYSYYEFEQPIDHRLTDKEWRIMLGIDMEVGPDGMPIWDSDREEVAQPSWVNEFKVTW